MKKEHFFCNLCQEEKNKNDLLCVYWDSTKKIEQNFGAYDLTSNVHAADKHICKSCFKMVYDFANEYKEMIKQP